MISFWPEKFNYISVPNVILWRKCYSVKKLHRGRTLKSCSVSEVKIWEPLLSLIIQSFSLIIQSNSKLLKNGPRLRVGYFKIVSKMTLASAGCFFEQFFSSKTETQTVHGTSWMLIMGKLKNANCVQKLPRKKLPMNNRKEENQFRARSNPVVFLLPETSNSTDFTRLNYTIDNMIH